MSAIYTIHQIMPLSIPMSACFYDHDDMDVTRRDVVCLAVVKFRIGDEPENSIARPMVCEKNGAIIDPGFIPNFLGFEINGIVENWDEKIRELVDKAEGKVSEIKKRVVN